jgi:hypothetical protein
VRVEIADYVARNAGLVTIGSGPRLSAIGDRTMIATAVRLQPPRHRTVAVSRSKTVEPMTMTLMPPAKDRCQTCAADHKPEEPHNPQSLYWGVARQMQKLPPPTWEDALAH